MCGRRLLFEPARFLFDETTNENSSRKVTQSVLEYTSALPEPLSDPIFAKINKFMRENTFLKCVNDISTMSVTHSHNQRYLDALNVLQATNVLPKIIKVTLVRLISRVAIFNQ